MKSINHILHLEWSLSDVFKLHKSNVKWSDIKFINNVKKSFWDAVYMSKSKRKRIILISVMNRLEALSEMIIQLSTILPNIKRICQKRILLIFYLTIFL